MSHCHPFYSQGCLPQEVWWGWVPSCSAKGVAQAKCCVSVEDYHLPDASSSSCLPAIPAARRADFSFSNCFASDYSHIWQKALVTACIQRRDNAYHVQCLVCTEVQISPAALHAAGGMGGGL